MIGIRDRDREWVTEHRGGLTKRHAVRSEVQLSFAFVPLEAQCHGDPLYIRPDRGNATTAGPVSYTHLKRDDTFSTVRIYHGK